MKHVFVLVRIAINQSNEYTPPYAYEDRVVAEKEAKKLVMEVVHPQSTNHQLEELKNESGVIIGYVWIGKNEIPSKEECENINIYNIIMFSYADIAVNINQLLYIPEN